MRAAKLTQSLNTYDGRTVNYKVTDYDLKRDWKLIEVDCKFHQFAQAGEGDKHYPVAIIELADGSLDYVALTSIKFIK